MGARYLNRVHQSRQRHTDARRANNARRKKRSPPTMTSTGVQGREEALARHEETDSVVDPIASGDLDGKKGDAMVVETDFELVTPEGTVGRAYTAKAAVLNQAVQDIGFGRYQIMLFLVIGFGWASDNLWPIVTSVILPPVGREFGRSSNRTPLITLAQNIGLFAGALFWGFGCDIFGRKWAFSLTLGFTSVFGLIAAGSPNFASVGIFDAFWSFGVGGNLPVDSAIFLEFLPATHQYLLTVLSTCWAVVQVFADLIAWGLVATIRVPRPRGALKAATWDGATLSSPSVGCGWCCFSCASFSRCLSRPSILWARAAKKMQCAPFTALQKSTEKRRHSPSKT